MDRKIDSALKFMESLELEEIKLLTWGITNGAFSKDEIKDRVRDFLSAEGLYDEFGSTEEFIEFLNQNAFIFKFRQKETYWYRTRMAEGVRLFTSLRQLFLNTHESEASWRTASTLTAGFRLLKRPRYYPKRDISASAAEDEILSSCSPSELQKELLRDLIKKGKPSELKLAEFQLKAIRTILIAASNSYVSGTIISSGTGSGKTIAFYIPALLNIADRIAQVEGNYTKCLAIYPRNELLKDQFAEIYMQARLLDKTLLQKGLRKIRIGTYFSGTPYRSGFKAGNSYNSKWKKGNGGFICPFMVCPDCGSPLVWKEKDITKTKPEERLECASPSCNKVIGSDEILLTRESIRDTPPDILFTTTEMLNQRISDGQVNSIFGVRIWEEKKRPSMVLLDEVHTYEGAHSAQIAMLLRRWKWAANCSPHYVGLSATLKNASEFFSSLIGVEIEKVSNISPDPKDMLAEGTEYMLVLRGDPASKASLLSTTIQASMLGKRLLNQGNNITPIANLLHPDKINTDQIFGKKVFVFTDDLDVTNRLYYNLMDAEGWDEQGNVKKRSLATIRNASARKNDDVLQRFLNGQIWKLAELIGYSLGNNERMIIGRTSSQDEGVLKDGDIIVATASLEVGYNDDEVGMVIQHKAPRQPAQFLQRKGRAGRVRSMRPWTVVVLSDYGRDRLTYQGYEMLFDPELEPIEIPILNKYVLRMQCVYAFMDWFSRDATIGMSGYKKNIWSDFVGPKEKQNDNQKNITKANYRQYTDIIKDILDKGAHYKKLTEYLKRSLHIDDSTLDSVLWEPPRALMTTVLPTLYRRLESVWCKNGKEMNDIIVFNNPLPEFIPQSLFSDLNLPEIIIEHNQRNGMKADTLPVFQGLREFAPGRVSKRFGISGNYRHWVFPKKYNTGRENGININEICPDRMYDLLGSFDYFDDNGGKKSIQCVRLNKITTTVPPKEVKDYTNARLDWRTQIVYDKSDNKLEIPTSTKWNTIIVDITLFTHNTHSPVEVRRFALGSKATIALNRSQDSFNTYIKFTENDNPVAPGFVLDVDGVMFKIKIPKDLKISNLPEHRSKLFSLRSEYFIDKIQKSPELESISNSFERGWIAQIYLSSLIFEALEINMDLEELFEKIKSGEINLKFNEVLNTIFQSIQEEGAGGEDSEPQQSDYKNKLLKLFANGTIIDVLHNNTNILWQIPDESWNQWLSTKFLSTLGGGILDAIADLCPEITISDLVLDIDSGPKENTLEETGDFQEIWITETIVGGGGVIERFLNKYSENPRRFFDLLDTSFLPSDFELMDSQLYTILKWMNEGNDSEIYDRINEIRNPESHVALLASFKKLIGRLVNNGIVPSHPVISAMNNRIFRPGSSEMTDELLYRLITDWYNREKQIGIEIDARVFAYLKSNDPDLDDPLQKLAGSNITDKNEFNNWKYEFIYSFLWPRGSMVRSQSLNLYNPYYELPKAERLLVYDTVELVPHDTIIFATENWRSEFNSKIMKKGEVVLRISSGLFNKSKETIVELISTPIDESGLLYYPNIKRLSKYGNDLDMYWEVREVL